MEESRLAVTRLSKQNRKTQIEKHLIYRKTCKKNVDSLCSDRKKIVKAYKIIHDNRFFFFVLTKCH